MESSKEITIPPEFKLTNSFECINCRKIEPKFTCSKCKEVYYCSKECQTSDWSSHKIICSELASLSNRRMVMLDTKELGASCAYLSTQEEEALKNPKYRSTVYKLIDGKFEFVMNDLLRAGYIISILSGFKDELLSQIKLLGPKLLILMKFDKDRDLVKAIRIPKMFARNIRFIDEKDCPSEYKEGLVTMQEIHKPGHIQVIIYLTKPDEDPSTKDAAPESFGPIVTPYSYPSAMVHSGMDSCLDAV